MLTFSNSPGRTRSELIACGAEVTAGAGMSGCVTAGAPSRIVISSGMVNVAPAVCPNVVTATTGLAIAGAAGARSSVGPCDTIGLTLEAAGTEEEAGSLDAFITAFSFGL